MEYLKEAQLDPDNSEHFKLIIHYMMKDIKDTRKEVGEIKKEVQKIREAANRWLPKTLLGWIILIGTVGGILWGAQEIMTVKDYEQDVSIQRLLSQQQIIINQLEKATK